MRRPDRRRQQGKRVDQAGQVLRRVGRGDREDERTPSPSPRRRQLERDPPGRRAGSNRAPWSSPPVPMATTFASGTFNRRYDVGPGRHGVREQPVVAAQLLEAPQIAASVAGARPAAENNARGRAAGSGRGRPPPAPWRSAPGPASRGGGAKPGVISSGLITMSTSSRSGLWRTSRSRRGAPLGRGRARAFEVGRGGPPGSHPSGVPWPHT